MTITPSLLCGSTPSGSLVILTYLQAWVGMGITHTHTHNYLYPRYLKGLYCFHLSVSACGYVIHVMQSKSSLITFNLEIQLTLKISEKMERRFGVILPPLPDSYF